MQEFRNSTNIIPIQIIDIILFTQCLTQPNMKIQKTKTNKNMYIAEIIP